MPREVLRRMGELGFLGIRYPAEYGGAEMDAFGSVVLAEELGRSTFGGIAITVLVHTDMASVHLANAGSPAQKAKWMPEIIAGRAITAVAVTEPDAGSDVKGIRTTARRDGDSYVIDGAKMFITNGVHADLYFVAAKSDPGSRTAKADLHVHGGEGNAGLACGPRARQARLALVRHRRACVSRTAASRRRICSARKAAASTPSCATSRTSAW